MGIKIRIIENGDGLLDKLDKTIVETQESRRDENRTYKATLRDVFNVIAAAGAGKAPRYPHGIMPETVEEVRGFMIARMPGLYAQQTGTWPGTLHRFLVDENMPKTTIADLWRDFGRATHTGFENMNGEKDPEVWRWAVRENIAAIVTRDRRMVDVNKDLGLIAVRYAYDQLRKRAADGDRIEMPDMPLLIQIASDNHKTTREVLALHRETIMAHLKSRTVPYMVLTDRKCYVGPSYADIARYDWTTVKTMVSDIDGSSRGKAASPPPSPPAPQVPPKP